MNKSWPTPQPIETAPKDCGILVFHGGATWEVSQWSKRQEKWMSVDDYIIFPTYWLPLPPAP